MKEHASALKELEKEGKRTEKAREKDVKRLNEQEKDLANLQKENKEAHLIFEEMSAKFENASSNVKQLNIRLKDAEKAKEEETKALCKELKMAETDLKACTRSNFYIILGVTAIAFSDGILDLFFLFLSLPNYSS